MTPLTYKDLNERAKKITCTRCGHGWKTRSSNRMVTCSACNRKTLNQWGKKQPKDISGKGKVKPKVKSR